STPSGNRPSDFRGAVAPSCWAGGPPTEGMHAVASLSRTTLAGLLGLVVACAPTRSTGTLPAEVLVVLDSIENQLTLISVDSTWARRSIALDDLGFVPIRLAAQGGIAV